MKKIIGFVIGAAVSVSLGIFLMNAQSGWVTQIWNWVLSSLGIGG